MDQIGLMWIEWTKWDQIEPNRTEVDKLNRSGLNVPNRTEVDQSGQNGPNRTKVDNID